MKLQNRCRQRQGLPGASIFVARFAGKEAKAGKVSLLLLLPFFAFAMPNPDLDGLNLGSNAKTLVCVILWSVIVSKLGIH